MLRLQDLETVLDCESGMVRAVDAVSLSSKRGETLALAATSGTLPRLEQTVARCTQSVAAAHSTVSQNYCDAQLADCKSCNAPAQYCDQCACRRSVATAVCRSLCLSPKRNIGN